MKKNFFALLSTLFFLIISFHAKSEAMKCTSSKPSYDTSLGNFFIPDDTMIGGILKLSTSEAIINCDGSNNYQQFDVGPVSGSVEDSGINANVDGLACPVLTTDNLKLIGVGFTWTNFNSNSNSYACVSSAILSNSDMRRGLQPNGQTILRDKIYFIRISKVDLQRTADIFFSLNVNEANVDREVRGLLYTLNISGRIIKVKSSCTIGNANVDMGEISPSQFRGVGNTGPNVPFMLSVSNCGLLIKTINLMFNPDNGYADESNSVIALNDISDSAKGLGIQIFMDGKLIDANNYNTYVIKNSLQDSIPFNARYYRLNESVTPGVVDASIVFSVFYE